MSSLDAVQPFLDEVAAPRPTVTGGGASAVTVATAASLLAMTARLSPASDAAERAGHAERLQQRALRLAASDSDSYGAVLAAQRRPSDDPGRAEALREALAAAAGPPGDIAALAAEVAELAVELATTGKRALRGDAITAVTLAAGAASSGAALARINATAAGLAGEIAEAAEASADSARRHADTATRCLLPSTRE